MESCTNLPLCIFTKINRISENLCGCSLCIFYASRTVVHIRLQNKKHASELAIFVFSEAMAQYFGDNKKKRQMF